MEAAHRAPRRQAPRRSRGVAARSCAVTPTTRVDVGGAFSDVVLHGGDGRVVVRKVLSTPPRYDRAVVDAVGALAGDATVGEVVHGTTVATNAVLERRGSLTALVTTAGFRDVL